MNVLVTGGTGSVGKAVVSRLVREGIRVLVMGRKATADIENAGYIQGDVTDYAVLKKASRGMDAIIHLAAVPSPNKIPDHELFHINVTGTFNVFEAARQSGISRVIAASSINAFGYFFGRRPFAVDSFPIDEETPGMTTDSYSFSKQSVEEIGRYYHRAFGISSISLRFPWVYHEKDYHFFKEGAVRYARAWQEWIDLRPEERVAKIRGIVNQIDRYRINRYDQRAPVLSMQERMSVWTPIMWGRNDFYTVIDGQDVAQAFCQSLKADIDGAHHLFVNDSHNMTGLNSRELAELVYPRPEAWTGRWKKPTPGTESLVSIDKARELIGFEPEYSVRRFL